MNGDGRPDLYVANDLDPNRLYVNAPGGPLGFHFVEEGRYRGVADRKAGMGVAAQDYSGDGRSDLFVTNSRGQGHAAFRSTAAPVFSNAQSTFAPAVGPDATGWGASWVDLANNGRLDLVLANGAIPVTNLKRDAGPIQVIGNLGGRFADASSAVGLRPGPLRQRARDRGCGLRQRRAGGHRRQLDRRQADPAPQHREPRGTGSRSPSRRSRPARS